MPRRHLLLSLALIALILGGGSWAFRLWQQQQRTALILAGVPPVPDLSRRSVELRRRLEHAIVRVETPATLRELAELYFANGFIAEARQALNTLHALEPAEARWPYLLSDLQRRSGDSAGEEQLLRATTALDSSYRPAWIRLGDLLVKRSALDEARACFTKAIALEPGNVRAEYALISFEARHGNRGDPRRALTQLAQKHPGIKQLHELLAELNSVAGDAAGATQQRHLAAVAERELENTDPWIDQLALLCFDANRLSLLAVAAYRERRLDDAERLLKQAIPLDPADGSLRDSLSHVHELLGRTAEARNVLEKAVAEIPGDPMMRARLARLLSLENRHDEAIALLRDALQRWPADAALHAALGFSLRDAKRNAEAMPAFREAVRLDPTFVEAHYHLGFSLLALGQRDAARAAVEKALAMRPDYVEALRFLGSLALDARDLPAAERHITRLRSLRPEDPGTRLLFAALQLFEGAAAETAGNPAEAEQRYAAGLDAAPDFLPLLRERGALAMRQKKFSDAAAAFERYVRFEPADPGGYLSLGKALAAGGRADEAREIFERGRAAAQKAGDRAKAEAEELRRLLAR
ncbi:MAG TPA: tetratricopeptide repeat protein [Opitutaceae bacterium]|nr:tetratricopeptide repeat protein [Opitutaceae bacterium]